MNKPKLISTGNLFLFSPSITSTAPPKSDINSTQLNTVKEPMTTTVKELPIEVPKDIQKDVISYDREKIEAINACIIS